MIIGRALATIAKGAARKGNAASATVAAATDDLHRMPTPVPVMMPAKRPSIEAPKLSRTSPVGSIVKLNPALLDAFKKSDLELPKFPAQAFSVLGSPFTLVRASLPELLDSTNFILEGDNGVGKSTTLLQLASLFMDAGQSFLYFPHLFRACQGYYAYEPNDGNGSYEQPDLAMAILKHHFSSPISVGPEEATGVLEGLLKREDLPIILDEVNCLFQPTAYHDAEGKSIPVEQMRVLGLLKHRVISGKNVYAAVCRQDSKARGSLDEKLPTVKLPPLTLKECSTLLDLYHRLGMMGVTLDPQVNGMMHLVSGGNGVDLLRAIRYDTLYLRNPEFK